MNIRELLTLILNPSQHFAQVSLKITSVNVKNQSFLSIIKNSLYNEKLQLTDYFNLKIMFLKKVHESKFQLK